MTKFETLVAEGDRVEREMKGRLGFRAATLMFLLVFVGCWLHAGIVPLAVLCGLGVPVVVAFAVADVKTAVRRLREIDARFDD